MLPLQNFVNGSVISAAWLNGVDILQGGFIVPQVGQIQLNGPAVLGAGNPDFLVVTNTPTNGAGGIATTTSVNLRSGYFTQNTLNSAISLAGFTAGGGSGTDNIQFFMTNPNWAANGLGIAGLPAGQCGVVAAIPGTNGAFPLALVTNNTVRVLIAANGTVTIPGGVQVGNAVASKAASTLRNTTTTLAADPDLVFPLLAGIYAIKMYVQPQASAGGNGGFKFNFSSTGTMTGTYGYTGGVVGAFVSAVGQSVLTGVSTFAALQNNPVDWLEITGQVVVTVPGTLSFQWAQNSSNAINSAVTAGSWGQLTKVG